MDKLILRKMQCPTRKSAAAMVALICSGVQAVVPILLPMSVVTSGHHDYRDNDQIQRATPHNCRSAHGEDSLSALILMIFVISWYQVLSKCVQLLYIMIITVKTCPFSFALIAYFCLCNFINGSRERMN